jgi:hypothetical protein
MLPTAPQVSRDARFAFQRVTYQIKDQRNDTRHEHPYYSTLIGAFLAPAIGASFGGDFVQLRC